MAGFLGLYAGTETIPVGTDPDNGTEYVVEIKKYLSREDYAVAQRVLMLPKMRARGTSSANGEAVKDVETDMEATLETEAYQQVLLSRAIISWNLTDEDGTELPLGKHPVKDALDRSLGSASLVSIKRLPQVVFNEIYRRVNELNSRKGLAVVKDDPALADVVEEGDRVSPETRFPVEAGVGGEDGEERAGDPDAVLVGADVVGDAWGDPRDAGDPPGA
ncbi:MAG: hypothetical protein ACRENL_11390 [Candidatus Dormibacteria bacterium]